MADTLSMEDQEFLARCEEELKDRYTEKDDEFIRVFNAEPAKPPVIDSWWVPNNFGHRNDRRNNRSFHPYDRQDRRRHRDNHERRDRGYNDYGSSYDDRNHRHRY